MKIFSKIQNKFLAIVLSISVIPLLLVGIYTVISSTKALEERAINSATKDVSLRIEKIKTFLYSFESDLLFLSETPPVQGIIRARQGNGYDEAAGSSYEQWVDRLQAIFKSFAREKLHYMQLRYLDETGQELVRVDSDGTIPQIIPRDQLQDKGKRYYFTETMKLSAKEIYVSPLDLNRERDEIEVPYRPVIRYATPVYDINGKNRGIVVTNVSANIFLEELEKWKSCMGEKTFLIDNNGFYLHHPDKTKEWGSPDNLNTGASLIQDYSSDVVSQILSGKPGQILIIENELMSYKPISPDPRNKKGYWVLMVGFPKSLFLQPVAHFRKVLISVILSVIAITIFLGIFFANLLVKPIRILMKAAKRVAKGDMTGKVECRSRDEIGDLCNIFNQMMEDLKQLESQLIRSEKLAAIGELAAGVAHEINNPLNVISGNAQLLSIESKDKETKRAIKIIIEQTKRAATITDRLLQFSRRKEPKIESLDVNKIIEDTLPLLEIQTKYKHIKMIKEFYPDLPKINGDLIQLQEVFYNIMLNAVQAMPNGGELRIRTSTTEITKFGKRRTDILKLRSKVLLIEFEDTGEGIPEEKLKMIFDPFFSTKEKGTGLGLSICHGIIETHQGTIEAQSKVGKGTIFIIQLPV